MRALSAKLYSRVIELHVAIADILFVCHNFKTEMMQQYIFSMFDSMKYKDKESTEYVVV